MTLVKDLQFLKHALSKHLTVDGISRHVIRSQWFSGIMID